MKKAAQCYVKKMRNKTGEATAEVTWYCVAVSGSLANFPVKGLKTCTDLRNSARFGAEVCEVALLNVTIRDRMRHGVAAMVDVVPSSSYTTL